MEQKYVYCSDKMAVALLVLIDSILIDEYILKYLINVYFLRYLNFPVSFSLITLQIKFVTYSPIQFHRGRKWNHSLNIIIMRCPPWSEHEGFYDRFEHHKDHLIIHFVFKVKNDSLFLRYNQCPGRILNFQGHRTYIIYKGGGAKNLCY